MITLGSSAAWHSPMTLADADRLRHLHVIGSTGTGKTTLLRNLVLQDVLADRGVGVIDPHGDLIDDLLDLIPPYRTNDVVLLDPSDSEHPPTLNLLAGINPTQRHLAVSGVVGSLKAIWRDSWGPRLEHLLGNAVAALVEAEGQSLLGVSRLFTDAAYRRRVVGQVKDPIVRSFWENEVAGYDKRFLSEAAAPIQNKIGQLLLSPPVRNTLGQSRRKIDFRHVVDAGQILLVRLPRGRLGSDKAALLGSLLIGQIELAALSRSDLPEGRRRPFHLHVDEFHTFTTDAFASMLAEVRKYGLGLTLAHQYLGQLAPPVRDAVFGSVGSTLCFRVGADDAEAMSRQFGGDLSASTLTGLHRHEAAARLMADGHPLKATGMVTHDLNGRTWGRGRLVRRCSRSRFTGRRSAVERRIARWLT